MPKLIPLFEHEMVRLDAFFEAAYTLGYKKQKLIGRTGYAVQRKPYIRIEYETDGDVLSFHAMRQNTSIADKLGERTVLRLIRRQMNNRLGIPNKQANTSEEIDEAYREALKPRQRHV